VNTRQLITAAGVAAAFSLGLLASKLVYGQLPTQAGPLGLPPRPEEVALGLRLFFDPVLSIDGKISCSTCHNPALGYTDGQTVAIGINGNRGTRNTPTLLNVGYVKPMVFWDGRNVETTDQSVLPLTNPREMGQGGVAAATQLENTLNRLRMRQDYAEEFAHVFPIDQRTRSAITAANLARAIASFEFTLTTARAPIDLYLAGNTEALTPDARIGYEIFKKANCASCHPAPLYTDNRTHNIGTEFASNGRIVDRGRAIVTAGTVRAQAGDVGAFKTPTLRGISLTGPYMHNGAFPSLESVVRHLNVGGKFKIPGRKGEYRDPNIDRRIVNQEWTPEQELYLARFLREAFVPADYPLVSPP
jgi:cytochrome c peroxidase